MHYISVKQEHGVPGPGQLFLFEAAIKLIE
jgi:hypothetical protein